MAIRALFAIGNFRLYRTIVPILGIVALAPWLAGCAGTLVGAGAAVGVTAYEERGIEGRARDLKATAQIIEQWILFDHTLATKVDVEVYEGRALLTGAVRDPATRADAVRLAWKAASVKDVINEVQVVADSDLLDLARDSWVTTQLRSRITWDGRILDINYAIETVNGLVYLIGTAQNQVELDRVVAHARALKYVKGIISHVRVKEAS